MSEKNLDASKPQDPSDEELIRRLREGDQGAFRKMVFFCHSKTSYLIELSRDEGSGVKKDLVLLIPVAVSPAGSPARNIQVVFKRK